MLHLGDDPVWMAAAFFACWCVVFSSIVVGLISLDRAVRLLHERHPETWERLGRPWGVFWTPPGAPTRSTTASYRGRNAATFALRALRRDPPPAVAADAELNAALRRHKTAILTGCVAMVLGAAVWVTALLV